jgi:hypothetical protein
MYSRLKENVDGGIPLEEGIEPSNPITRNQDPHDYSLAFLRAPPWLLANSYQMEHGLTLEFPLIAHRRPSELTQTRVV